MKYFEIVPADGYIWNRDDFIKFLISNQGEEILISIRSEGACLKTAGVYALLDLFKFKQVTIRTSNIFEAHDLYTIDIHDAFKFFKVSDVDYAQYHTWSQNKLFGVLYNRPIWHRIGIASHVLHNHADKAVINFRANPHSEDDRKLFELQKLFEVNPTSALQFLQHDFPVQLENQDGYTVGATTVQHTDQLASFYRDFLIDIVAETFVAGKTFFVTEKTVRPMLMKKPFIVMGSKCFLIHLRQMGFKTFNDFWSEDYDGYAGKDRYNQILDIVDKLAKKSLDELGEMYYNMNSILDHNYNLLLSQRYNQVLEYVD
jgi:hypothetical protein